MAINLGRVALVSAAVVHGGVMVGQALTLPWEIPARVTLGGTVERWDTKAHHMILFAGVALLIVGILGTTTWVRRVPRHMFSLPHQSYWTRQENWPVAVSRLSEDMAWVGAATMALTTWVMHCLGVVAHGEALSSWALPVPVVAWMGFILFMGVRMLTSRFRPPSFAR